MEAADELDGKGESSCGVCSESCFRYALGKRSAKQSTENIKVVYIVASTDGELVPDGAVIVSPMVDHIFD